MIRNAIAGTLLIVAGVFWGGWIGVILIFCGGCYFGEAATYR